MSKPRILFADDSVTIQQVFEFAFENENIEVTLASDGREAFEKAKEFRPDIVIADVNMPHVDGFELCQLIKDDPSLSSIPVYLLSSSLEEFDLERSETVGADGNFNKPFKSEEMLSKVRKVIEEIPEPATAVTDEYTFDEIDVSIDSILEGIEEAVEKEGSTLDPRLDEIESAVEEALASSHVLALGAEAKVEVAPDEEDELAVEVISGEALTPDTDFGDIEKLGEELGEIPGTEFSVTSAIGQDNTGPSEKISADISSEEVQGAIAEDTKDGPAISEEDINDAPNAGDMELEDEIEIEINLPPDSPADDNAKAEAAQDTSKAATTAGALRDSAIDESINETIREAVEEKLKSAEMEKLLASMIQSAMMDLKPEMLAMLKKVAQDMTLEVAEDMVKQTIEQIKNEK
ncbi:hypothetical protein MNBD_NITROSPINAE02-965 [hydrothermal vent metagenome]|uniref:Response regulatory domain-containing protein n=1 Tax=hydrothermal vent metagenome TaxID=652676 RepID=A0A3B1CFZ1_9ZZZZ